MYKHQVREWEGNLNCKTTTTATKNITALSFFTSSDHKTVTVQSSHFEIHVSFAVNSAVHFEMVHEYVSLTVSLWSREADRRQVNNSLINNNISTSGRLFFWYQCAFLSSRMFLIFMWWIWWDSIEKGGETYVLIDFLYLLDLPYCWAFYPSNFLTGINVFVPLEEVLVESRLFKRLLIQMTSFA